MQSKKYLAMVSLLALAACKGAGPQSAGSSAVGNGATGQNASQHTFVKPTVAKTYQGIGGSQSYKYSTDNRILTQGNRGQYNQLYASNSTRPRDTAIQITYDPHDGIFELKVGDSAAGVTVAQRFQDPAHRTAFGGLQEPGWGNVQFPAAMNIRYLETGTGKGIYSFGNNITPPGGQPGAGTDVVTMFYEVPGTTTQYVSYAGYIRNQLNVGEFNVQQADGTFKVFQQDNWDIERGAFVYGERTDIANIPKTGSGTYSGAMLATMVNNPTLDTTSDPTYFQWIYGTSKTTVDFATLDVKTSLTGTVSDAQYDRWSTPPATPMATFIPSGATFTAEGSAKIDMNATGGFAGQMATAQFKDAAGNVLQSFAYPTNVQDAVNAPGVIAGSGLDGTFFGPGKTPDKIEVGGSFQIVGGTPDQRIDITGAFTGKPN